MTLAEIEAFVAVVDAGSMISAAARVNLTQPALSRRIQQLEAGLGQKLLDRSSRPIKPTMAGINILPSARAMLTAASGIKAGARLQAPRSYRLGIPPYFPDAQHERLVASFQMANPAAKVVLVFDTSARLLERLKANDLHAALLISPQTPVIRGDIVVQKLGKCPVIAVAPKAARLPPSPSVFDVGEFGWVMNVTGCHYHEKLEQQHADAGLALAVNAEAFSDDFRLRLAAKGAGIAIVSPNAFEPYRADRSIRQVEFRDFELGVSLFFASQRGDVMAAQAIAALTEMMVDMQGEIASPTIFSPEP